MLYMESTSAPDGTYILTVTFEIGTDPNIDQVLVQNRVQLALASLPEPVQAQGVSVQKKNTAILQIVTLNSPNGKFDGLLHEQLRDDQSDRRARTAAGRRQCQGVRRRNLLHADLDGPGRSCIPTACSRRTSSTRSGSRTRTSPPAGRHAARAERHRNSSIPSTSSRGSTEPEQFGSIVVKDQTAQGGRLIHVRDIAPDRARRSDLFAEFPARTANPPPASRSTRRPSRTRCRSARRSTTRWRRWRKRFPEGLHYAIPYDTTIFVKDSIAEVYKTLYEAGILVLIVILVFLQNFRATLVPATTVPVTIIGAFAGMAALGFTVNLSTLFGIVLAIGIVVDDAIVIVEGVTKYIERGMSGHDAAIQAMDELFGPVVGITLVLMAVFLPAAFVPA